MSEDKETSCLISVPCLHYYFSLDIYVCYQIFIGKKHLQLQFVNKQKKAHLFKR